MSYVTIPSHVSLSTPPWLEIKKLCLEADMLRCVLSGRSDWQPATELQETAAELQAERQQFDMIFSTLRQIKNLVSKLYLTQSLKRLLQRRLDAVIAERDYRLSIVLGRDYQVTDVRNQATFSEVTLPPINHLQQPQLCAA